MRRAGRGLGIFMAGGRKLGRREVGRKEEHGFDRAGKQPDAHIFRNPGSKNMTRGFL